MRESLNACPSFSSTAKGCHKSEVPEAAWQVKDCVLSSIGCLLFHQVLAGLQVVTIV